MIHQSMFSNELYKSVKLDDANRHPSLKNSDSEIIHHKPRYSKIPSFNKFLKLLDLFDNIFVYDSHTSFVEKSKFCLRFDQLQVSKKNTRTKYDSQQQPKKECCLFLLLPSFL